MNRKILLAMMLATGMAMAQTGSSGQQSTDQQQPTTAPSTSSSTSQNPVATQSDQTSMSGCLKRSGDNFVLAADNGQSVNLTGDSSLLKPHEGHAIHVLGTLASDGSLQVSQVNMLSETCADKQSSVGGAVSGAAGATAGAVSGAAGAVASGTEKAAGATKDAVVSGSEHAYDATKSAAGAVAGGTQDAAKDAASATQNAAGSAANATQNAASDAASSAPSTAGQSTTAPSSTAPATTAAADHHKLPQSASPLPLLALLGLGSLVSGLIARRK